MRGFLKENSSAFTGFFYFEDCTSQYFLGSDYYRPNEYMTEDSGWLEDEDLSGYTAVLPEEFL